jgi:hypothetical protein
MAFLPAVLGVAGAAMSAFGSIYAGQAQANAANYNAQVQAQLAQQRREEGAAHAEQATREMRRNLGLQRAAIGESGFGYSGSLFDVSQQSAANQDLDVLTLAHEGNVAAIGHLNNAQRLRAEAEAARTGGYIGGATRLLSGLGSFGYGRSGTGGGMSNLWV